MLQKFDHNNDNNNSKSMTHAAFINLHNLL